MTVSDSKLSILVVLYGCELNESNTLNSLAKLSASLDVGNVVVWNNGPKNLDKEMVASFRNSLDFELVETINNISLAKIYNEFIKSNDVDNYMFLDHDTSVNIDYITESKAFVGIVAAPKIYSNGNLHSPRFINKSLFSSKEITAIGSGLIVSKEVATLLYKKYGSVFDERFVLYGVDTTFFYRLGQTINLESDLMVLPELQHSLSSNEVESVKVNEFRVKEKSYDFGLRLRYYPTLDKFVLLIRQLRV